MKTNPTKAINDQCRIKKTLQYLKQKYDLVVLSNWFKKSQDERLKRLGLDKYFSTTYMTENIPMKPNKEAFEIAKGPYEFSECVMVGDSLKTEKTIDFLVENAKIK